MTRAPYVMIAASYPPRTGGVERHVAAIHRELGAQGRPGVVIVLREEPEAGGGEATWVDFPRGLSRLRVLTSPGSLIRFLRSLRSVPGAVLHFHDAATLHPFLPYLELFGLLGRTFITFHGWEGVVPPEPVVVRQRRECAAAAAGSILVGDFIRTWYGTTGDVVTYGGADVGRFADGFAPAAGLPLGAAFVGRFDADTGVAMVAEAARSAGSIPVTFYGSGKLEQELRSAGARVEPAPKEILDVYRSSPVVIASGYLTILEALCARRVVIACYDNPLRRDYLALHPAAGSMLLCGSAGELSAALERCRLELPALLDRAAPAWAWAREQSWQRLAATYQALWDSPPRREGSHG
jgi:glycosyltransferase involved in cell wall biosynthesis